MVTFDGQRFVFDGNCEYILATVRLGGGTGHGEAWGQGATVRPRRAGAWWAPPQHPLPTGWLWRQRLAAHVQDSDRECRVWEVGGHLLPGHQDLSGGEWAGGCPRSSTQPQILAPRPRDRQQHLPEPHSLGGGSPRRLAQPSAWRPVSWSLLPAAGSAGPVPSTELACSRCWPHVSVTDSESAGGEAEPVALRPGGRRPGDSPAPQGLSITLADRNYTVSGADPDAHFRVQAGSLHLLLDVAIGSSYNLTLVWNKHMSVFIKIARAAQVPRRPTRRPPGGGWRAPA